MKPLITLLFSLLTFAGIAAAGDYEMASYTAEKKTDNIEIRSYKPMLVAEVRMPGEREKAISQAFQLLFDYISGNNQTDTKIAMTVPVTQQANDTTGTKIAMTVPVTQQETEANVWAVHFVMPSEYTLQSIPKPKNPNVTLRELPAKKMIAIQFSGFAGQESLAEQTAQLLRFVQDNGLKTQGNAIHAYYDPPWTLPWWRRNEVLFELAK